MRVLVVGGHRFFTEALAFRLGLERDISGTSAALPDGGLGRHLEMFRPDVVITDLESGQRSALDALRHVHEAQPTAKTIALVAGDAADLAAAAVRNGASAVLTKEEPASRLVEAIGGVLRGETHIAPGLLTGVIAHLTGPGEKSEWETKVARLTDREREVLGLIVAGHDRAEIAQHLYLSVNTVRTHVKNILAKLEVHSTLEAVGVALRAGVQTEAAA